MAVLDRFNGGNDPEGWILRAEQYFTYLGFSRKDWLPLPYFYLEGEALVWFTWLQRNKQFFDWKHFTEKLLVRFPQCHFADSSLPCFASFGFAPIAPPEVQTLFLTPKSDSKVSNEITDSESDVEVDATIKASSTEINAQMFDSMSHGCCCSKVIDTERSDVRVLIDAMGSGLTSGKLEEVVTSEIESNLDDSNSSPYADQVFENFSHRAEQLLPVLSLTVDDPEIIGPVLNNNFESDTEFGGNLNLIIGDYECPLVIHDGEGNIPSYAGEENSHTYVRQVIDSLSLGTRRTLAEHEVFELLWVKRDLLLLEGIRLTCMNIFIQLPFDPGDTFESEEHARTKVIASNITQPELQNESELQSQFAHLQLVVTENSVSHDILPYDFDEPTNVEGEASLILHTNNVEIAEFFPWLFNHPSLDDFGNLAMSESMKNGLPTCYWFDTGQHISQPISFVFMQNYYSITDGLKPAWEGAAHNLLLESGNSKVDQVFGTMSNGVCKVCDATFTSLLIAMLIETPKQMETVQQCRLKCCANVLISFGSRVSAMSDSHFAQALPASCIDFNFLYSGSTRWKTELAAFEEVYIDTIFIEPMLIEDLYLDKLFWENASGAPKSEMHSAEPIIDVENEICERLGHADCILPFDPGVNMFFIMYGGTVMVNCTWDPGISSKTLNQNGGNETIAEHFFWSSVVSSPISNYFVNHLKMNTRSKEGKQKIPMGLFVFPYMGLRLALENEWHILLDLWALRAKDMFVAIKFCALGIVDAALPRNINMEPEQVAHVYNGRLPSNDQYLSTQAATQQLLEASKDQYVTVQCSSHVHHGLPEILCLDYANIDWNLITPQDSSKLLIETINGHVKVLQFLVLAGSVLVMSISHGWASLHLLLIKVWTLLRRFFRHQNSVTRYVKDPKHVRKLFQIWAFDSGMIDVRLDYLNLEDKVLIGTGCIVMNGPGPIFAKQPNTGLSGYVWDPG